MSLCVNGWYSSTMANWSSSHASHVQLSYTGYRNTSMVSLATRAPLSLGQFRSRLQVAFLPTIIHFPSRVTWQGNYSRHWIEAAEALVRGFCAISYELQHVEITICTWGEFKHCLSGYIHHANIFRLLKKKPLQNLKWEWKKCDKRRNTAPKNMPTQGNGPSPPPQPALSFTHKRKIPFRIKCGAWSQPISVFERFPREGFAWPNKTRPSGRMSWEVPHRVGSGRSQRVCSGT